MEVAIYGILTSLWWISSATILLPVIFLLKYSKYFRNRWFSFLFINCLKHFEPMIIPIRKKTFQLLKDNLSERDTAQPLKILEIGIGSGANFQFYPENSHLTALDINVNFDAYFQANQKKYPNIKYEKTVMSPAENMKDVRESSMDVVISTYVLCSVTNVNDVLQEVKRVLKPGGKFLFLEHVSHPRSNWGLTIQKFADPIWKIYCDGCCLVRNIEDHVRNAGYSDVICEKISPESLLLFVRPQIYGIATK